jgi:DNA repair ATPase RecN
VLAILAVFSYAQQDNQTVIKPGKVDIISFVTLDGNTIRARIISEDKSQITVSYPQQSKMITLSYNRDQFFPNSVSKQSILEIDYWTQLGDLFESQIWDFQNDPDDFINAIRSYEKARDIAAAVRGDSHELAKFFQQKIDELNLQLQKWEQTAQKRIEQIKLENQATAEDKFKDIYKAIDENNQRLAVIENGLSEFKKTEAAFDELQTQTQDFQRITSDDIENLNQLIQTNSRQIDYLWRRVKESGYYYRYYGN